MTGSNRIEFSEEVRRTAAERAGYRCSFPGCDKVTIGPDGDSGKSASNGRAAHIYSAASLGPRGQAGLSEGALRSIRNCMWLCSTHAALVDCNRGTMYPASLLYGYRDLHESRIARELGGLPVLKGWLESVTLQSNPLFESGATVRFGKSTVLRGLNGTGKTALLEWLRSALSSLPADRWAGCNYAMSVRFCDSVASHELHFDTHDGVPDCVLDARRVPFNPVDVALLFVTREGGSFRSLERIAAQLGISVQQMTGLIPFVGGDPRAFVRSAVLERGHLEVMLDESGAPRMGVSFDQLSAGEQELFVLECALAYAGAVSMHRPVVLCLDADFGIFDTDTAAAVLDRISAPALRFQTVLVCHDFDVDLSGWQVYDFAGIRHPRSIESVYGQELGNREDG